MMKSVVSRAGRLAKGLAVTLVHLFGVVTTALAAVPGDPLKLGQLNAINALTRLVGDHEGAVLLIDNNSGVSNARALDLRVESGRAPIVVNPEAATAKNLSADELDGKSSEAFLSASVYEVRRDIVITPNILRAALVECDEGDVALGGGYAGLGPDTQITSDSRGTFPLDPSALGFNIRNSSAQEDNISLLANCVDLPPLR
jgi:hypothetical protein